MDFNSCQDIRSCQSALGKLDRLSNRNNLMPLEQNDPVLSKVREVIGQIVFCASSYMPPSSLGRFFDTKSTFLSNKTCRPNSSSVTELWETERDSFFRSFALICFLAFQGDFKKVLVTFNKLPDHIRFESKFSKLYLSKKLVIHHRWLPQGSKLTVVS